MLSGQLSGQTRSMIFSWPDPDTEKKPDPDPSVIL